MGRIQQKAQQKKAKIRNRSHPSPSRRAPLRSFPVCPPPSLPPPSAPQTARPSQCASASGPPSSAQRPSPSVRLRRSASELPNFSRAAAHRGGSTKGWGAAASRDIQGRRVRSAPAPARQRPSGLRRRVLLRKPAAQQGKMIAGLPWGRPAEGMTNSISSHPVLIISEFVGSGASS